MKQFIAKTAMAAAICFTASTNADAQLSNILGSVLDKSNSTSSSSSSSDLSSTLSSAASGALSSLTGGNSTLSSIASVISSNLVPTSTQIVGTWAYQEPAIMFTSDNALKSAVSSVVTNKAETYMQNYLTKIGVKKGGLTMTFASDSTFTINKNSTKIAGGTYTISNNEISLTFKGRTTPCKVTPQLDNGTLAIVMDATKLKTFFQNITSNVSQLSTITTLLKNANGMKLGIRLSKQ